MTSLNRTPKTFVKNEPRELDEEDDLAPRGVECRVCRRDRWRVAFMPAKAGSDHPHLAVQCGNKSCGPVDTFPVRLVLVPEPTPAAPGPAPAPVASAPATSAVDLTGHKYFRFILEPGVAPEPEVFTAFCCCHKRPLLRFTRVAP